ncbi:MAG: respiratory nitrate reductase subunit gamma, partial [Pirellulales bacterium]|nr:respiratory nitrate reductase subunit gamma [Pirellulales bacterium]
MTDRFLDVFLFVALPYVCLFTFFLMTIYRYRAQSFSYSSLSSQFLENRHHFWAVVPFHYGILIITAGHLIAFLIPRSILLWNSHPLRLYVLEIAALAFGIMTLIGLVAIIVRRFTNTKIRRVTTLTDW